VGLLIIALLGGRGFAADAQATTGSAGANPPSDAVLAKFHPAPAPRPAGLVLRTGDRLAICGDSITEQKMYSRVIETYLTVCMPDLKIAVRQYGWGGETAPGFLARMTNDCLRFQPTVATTCYGMNDHGYRAYEPAIGERYRDASGAIVRAFKAYGTQVIQGSPGCVGPKVPWSKASSDDMNLNLGELRNLGIALALEEQVGFADVFWPMIVAGRTAQARYGTDYLIAGKDGVHPDWAGSFVMAYAFLRALGLDGDLGTFTVDLAAGRANVTPGHDLHGMSQGELTITSHRYPFCAAGDINRDNSIRSAMTLVPFNAELNRLRLVVKGTSAAQYKIVWGPTSRVYSSETLAQGINLADDFILNPFSDAFRKVDEAVAAKQAYETKQIKTLFHGDEGRVDLEATVALTEKARQRYTDEIAAAFVPITHKLRIVPE
jgi:lysophospholipase L1-like esterase